jgi:hypothetical protein
MSRRNLAKMGMKMMVREIGLNTETIHGSPLNSGGMIQRMEASRPVIETKFLDAGKIMSQAVEGIATLVTTLDEMAKALSPTTIAATTEQLHVASAQLAALPGRQSERRATIAQLEHQRAILSSSIEDMRRSLTYMRAFTVSIKITAGGIANADAEFEVFAQEMCQRVESGRGEVDALEQGLFTLKGELQTAILRAEALEQGSADTIPTVSNQLRDAAGMLASHRTKIGAATADASTLAKSVRKQVMRMLVALQIGDSTRQRVEHIQAGIASLGAIDPAIPAQDAARIRALMGVLLAAHLDATLLDFNREVTQINTGLEGLSRDATALLSLRDVAYGQNATEAGGFLRSLEQRVGTAVRLATEIEEADALARDTGKQAASAARILADRLGAIQMMKSEVQYMALNTTLKSTRLGDAGRPLSTIATELRAHAGYLEGTANSCVTALKTLIETASGLSSELPETMVVEDQSVGAALSAAIDRINAAAGTTERDVAVLSANGEAVLNLLQDSRHGLEFHDEIATSLGLVGEDLHGLAASAQPCDDNIRIPLTAAFAKLGAIYTMAQEREIHAAIAASWDVEVEGLHAPYSEKSESKAVEDALF